MYPEKMSEGIIAVMDEELKRLADGRKEGIFDDGENGIPGVMVDLDHLQSLLPAAWHEKGSNYEVMELIRNIAVVAIDALHRIGCPRRFGDPVQPIKEPEEPKYDPVAKYGEDASDKPRSSSHGDPGGY